MATKPILTFYMSIYRGRNEREFDLEITYTATARVAATYWQPEEGGDVEILEVTHNGCLFETTPDEDDGIQDAAERRADDDLAAWADDQDYDDAPEFTPLAWAAEAYVPGGLAA